jgi:hypothetical protein
MRAETAEFVFSSLLCSQLDVPGIALEGYQCFETYFLHINCNHGALLTPHKDTVTVTDRVTLMGLPTLWKLVECSRVPAVAMAASSLLISLHTKLDFTLPAVSFRDSLDSLVTQAMGRLAELRETEGLVPGRGPSQKRQRMAWAEGGVEGGEEGGGGDDGLIEEGEDYVVRCTVQLLNLMSDFLKRCDGGDVVRTSSPSSL